MLAARPTPQDTRLLSHLDLRSRGYGWPSYDSTAVASDQRAQQESELLAISGGTRVID